MLEFHPQNGALINHNFLPFIVPPDATTVSGGTLSFSVWPGISLCIASAANRFRFALRVYNAACVGLSQPNIAMSWCSVAPLSAALVAPAFRRPCAVQCGSPACRHHNLNLLPNAFELA